MRKPVSARLHGVLDYATVAAFLNAPMVFGFHGTPAAIVYWVLAIVALTDYSQRVEIPPQDPNDRRRWRGPSSAS